MAFPILGALKLAINAGSHIYKKKTKTFGGYKGIKIKLYNKGGKVSKK